MWKYISSYFENEKPFVSPDGYMPKDVYEYLTNFADDKTILNMLSVNKKFNDEQFFKRVLQRKYPLLLRFKGDEISNETYKQFFIRMVYYISKLEEEFSIPYIPHKNYNPESFFWPKIPRELKITDALYLAIELKDLNIVKHIVEGNPNKELNSALYTASSYGDLEIVKYLVSRGADGFAYAIEYAGQDGNTDIVEFLLEQIIISGNEEDYDYILDSLVRQGNFKNVKLVVEKVGDEISLDVFTFAIATAEDIGHTDIVEYLEQYIQ
tara:strand:- start:122 stop:922 length:801 start_codon:yes stop_codon:yes gene_type:complete